ncbi:hypothetical protein [Cupriavidus sp. Marseille-Q8015]
MRENGTMRDTGGPLSGRFIVATLWVPDRSDADAIEPLRRARASRKPPVAASPHFRIAARTRVDWLHLNHCLYLEQS